MRNLSYSENGAVRGPHGAHRANLVSSLPVTERWLEAAGIPTAVLEGGDGPPVVLLHGQGEFAVTWLQVIPHLAKKHRVIAADLPGHGASRVGAHPLDAERMVAWLEELIEQTCEEPPILAGHLLGGAVAARYASRHSDRLRHLVLVDAMGLAPYRPSPRFALAMITFVAHPTETTRDRLFSRCMDDLDDVRGQLGARWTSLAGYALERAKSSDQKAALRSMMPALGLPAVAPEDLERITVPAAMIWGRHDLQVRLSVAENAHARYGWPLYVIENAADDPAVEQPRAFLAAWDQIVGEGQGASDRSTALRPRVSESDETSDGEVYEGRQTAMNQTVFRK